MKKYWKTILISLVIVTTIGFYYIQAAMASKDGVSFKIETTNGKKEEIENLIFEATFQSGDMDYPLYITKDGSTVLRRQSIIEKLIAAPVPLEFEKYIQEHRNFMRGKERIPSKYFEDEARLIYTNFTYNYGEVMQGDLLTLQIDILDKQTNDSTSFEIKAPAQASYYGMDVDDVNVLNGKIKILVTGYFNDRKEVHIYTVDENKKELEDDSIIAQSESDMSSIRIYNDFSKIQNENYYLFKLEEYKNQMEDAESEIISSQVYLYNSLNNEVEELDMPDKLKRGMDSMILHGVDIFIPVHSADGLELNRYNIESKQWGDPLHFNYLSVANDEEEPFLQLTDGKLYLVNHVSDGYSLFIGDLRTGESLYEGKIINENRENLDIDNFLYFNQIYSIN